MAIKPFATFLQEEAPKSNRGRQKKDINKYDIKELRSRLEAAKGNVDKLTAIIRGTSDNPGLMAIKKKDVYDLIKEFQKKYNFNALKKSAGSKAAEAEDDNETGTFVLKATVTLDTKIAKAERKCKSTDFEGAKEEAKAWKKELGKRFPDAEDIEVDIENGDGERLTFNADPHGREDVDSHSISR